MKKPLPRHLFLDWTSIDWGVIALASILVIITRWFYHAKYLFHWDSVQFALGMQGMDILQHRPHPPGYIFYVWLGQLAKLFVHDDNLSLITVGILASIVGVVIIYLFARQLFQNRWPAILAVAFFVFNTSIWFHGLVAEVYIVESIVALAVIWRLYLYWQAPSFKNLFWAIGLLGLVGGFRQTTELALLPLALFVFWQTRVKLKHWLTAGAVLLLTNLIWIIPVCVNTGGLLPYLQAITKLSNIVVGQYYRNRGFFGQAISNLKLVGEAMIIAVPAEMALLVLASAPYLVRGADLRYRINWRQVSFWLLAIGGPILLTVLILMTNPGYILLPIILIGLLTAGGVWQLMIALRSGSLGLSRLWIIASVLILFVSQFFHFFIIRPEQSAFITPSLPSVTEHAKLLDSIKTTIQDNSNHRPTAVWISTSNTVIFFGFRHLQYYLPDLDIYRGLPDSLLHPKDKTVWHAKGPNYEVYEDKIYISDPIERLFTIRETWDALHRQYEIPITMPTGHTMVYYDLTDLATREYLSANYNFVFLKDVQN